MLWSPLDSCNSQDSTTHFPNDTGFAQQGTQINLSENNKIPARRLVSKITTK